MDLDRYIAKHKSEWNRLEHLSSGGRRALKKRSPDEMDELIGLYQAASTHLSYVQTYYRDPALVLHLTRIVSSARSLIYGTRARNTRAPLKFFSITFPAAIYRAKYFLAVSTLLFIIPAIVCGVWIANSDAALEAAAPPALREAYVNHEFEEYYESERASQFASTVYTNNVQVAIVVFAGGIVFCIPSILTLIANGASLGFAGGLFATFGEQAKFWGLITPHGLLEITSVCIAGAAGLQLGWALIDPGDKRRAEAVVEEAKRAVVIVIGLIIPFGVAGLIEGFVTGQPWSTWLRVGIGVLVEALFVAYIFYFGRKATRNGFTGAMGEIEATGWDAEKAYKEEINSRYA